jgi:hypothetical protein
MVVEARKQDQSCQNVGNDSFTYKGTCLKLILSTGDDWSEKRAPHL